MRIQQSVVTEQSDIQIGIKILPNLLMVPKHPRLRWELSKVVMRLKMFCKLKGKMIMSNGQLRGGPDSTYGYIRARREPWQCDSIEHIILD